MYGEKAKKYNEEKEKEEARKEEEKKKQAEWLASHPGQFIIFFPSLANLRWNSWTAFSVEFSGHKLESPHTWIFVWFSTRIFIF